MTLDELCGRRVAIWGIGTEGVALARLLIDRGVTPILLDDQGPVVADRVAGAVGTELAVSFPTDMAWSSVDVVVRSPGVSRYRPELAAAESAGVTVTTAMAVWLEDFHPAAVLAVTGTKGKSTTASLAASILEHQGRSVALVGNIGAPVTELYDRPPAEVYVVEVSSYQAADVTISPRVCVLTSLAPDHLDWHGGEETYYRDKLRLITAGPAGALAVSADSPEALRRTADRPDRLLFGSTGRVRVEASGTVVVDGEPVADAGRLRLPGAHNLTNLCGAIAGVLLVEGEAPSSSAVTAAVDGYQGLPSRCRTVGTRGGIEFVDDALASNPFATVASLGAFPGRDLTVIVGGADRGTDPDQLLRSLEDRQPVPRVVVLGDGEDRASVALRGSGARVPVEVATDMADAVRRATAVTPVGGVVLFSPAAPTPNGGGGYAQRSREFVAAAGLGEVPADS
jgi:UDP-N-acetylmuramoylalanine--D-glutamate ligase